ncbi:ribonuclease S-7-like [Solanum stenotomum]|uniref:ribonuclease S-7-like n=1 Tax=Solanum stenotomum TaxID=172797 RepID=UPI0020D18B7E|nr:ribonuclease S-7-like [Solanum stenotomum]
MFRQLESVFIVLLFTLSPGYGNFEYLQFVLTWPATFCHTRRCVKIPNNFTIHGLWPDNKSTQLNFCSTRPMFKTITDEIKKEALQHHWPNLTTNKVVSKRDQVFWRKEYDKHGTCCSNLFNQNQYFDLAIELKDKFDLLNILGKNGITSGTNHLTSHKIQSAIKSITKGIPNLICSHNYKAGTTELWQIAICLDQNIAVIDCPLPKICTTKGTTGITFP